MCAHAHAGHTHKLFFTMRIVFTLLLFPLYLFSLYLFSQTSGLIIDKSTGKGVPYVNIWIENENIGTTSDFYGKFLIKGELTGKYLILSAVGYERQKVEINGNSLTIKLTPKTYEIEEAVINQSENSSKIGCGEFNKSKIRHYYACGSLSSKVSIVEFTLKTRFR